jgi:uncharacterized protein (DUF2336 family)
MDLGFLDRSSNVTPLLVRLYDSHKLYGLAKDRKPMARAELTDAVCDLLGMDLSPREGELVADVLIELLRQAERDLRRALSERLSVMDKVPLRLILQIANDEIDIATPVLKNSPVLGDLDLIYIIKAKTSEYWQAIAARAAMSAQVMDMLADTGDFETALALAQNNKITLTHHTALMLSDMAQGSEDLAAPLLRRADVPAELAGKLYQHVGQALKQYILDNYEVTDAVLTGAIDDIVMELTSADDDTALVPSAAMISVAERYKEQGLLNIALMLATLRRGQVGSFVAQFAKFTGLAPKTVAEIMAQPNGQGLAVACKAFGILKPDFISIYLLTGRVRGPGRTADLGEMNRAVEYFNRIDEKVAQDIMRNSLEDSPST